MDSDSPILVLSQDYELFFGKSGTVEKCLFEPCDALLETARNTGLKVTFFVDAGMIICMQRFSTVDRLLASTVDRIRAHITSMAAAGHEIALHVHPHWEDSSWKNDAWDFSGTRYQLRDFSKEEISEIFTTYTNCLGELAGGRPSAYRAGGFCIEPFGLLKSALKDTGITIDSSVLPGAYLRDQDKGFDFRHAPGEEWWLFDESPLQAVPSGHFLELPITPQQLPFSYYWQRLMQRAIGEHSGAGTSYGDGTSKRIGKAEIVRRLLGRSNVAELSIDEPKVKQLAAGKVPDQERHIWQLMGHPKLLSMASLDLLQDFISRMDIGHYETVTSVAARIHSGAFGRGPNR